MPMDTEFASPDDFLALLKEKNPGQELFIQTASEIVESVWEWLQGQPKLLQANILTRFFEPERVVQFRVTWYDDEGRIQVNRGFRVQHSSTLGPYKGGLRFHRSVTVDTLKMLSTEQILKNALTSLPLGGGKGGSDFDPKGKSDAEVIRFCQSFMTELQRHIGASTDVPAGDIGVGAREIGALFGQYKRLRNEFTGVLTGKPLLFGGSKMRTEATGFGIVYYVDTMLRHMQQSSGKSKKAPSPSRRSVNKNGGSSASPLAGKAVSVSGSGNVAQGVAEKCLELGAKVVSLSDSSGTVLIKGGLTADMLSFVKELKNERRGRISELAERFKSGGCEFLEGATPWAHVKCDVAIPAATQNELDMESAQALIKNKVTLVCEGANMPCTPEAVRAFQEARVLFGPAKAANAGGVGVSGLEMAQNSQRVIWSAQEVDDKLHDIMISIHDACVEEGGGDANGYVDYLKGANLAGFKRVAQAMLEQGPV